MSLVFFTDRDLGNVFPATLTAHGLTVERHAAHFPPDCPDEQWLGVVGSCGWVAVTRDTRIRYRPNELAANFVRTVPRIQALLERNAPPLIAKVYRASAADLTRNPRAAGTASIWYP